MLINGFIVYSLRLDPALLRPGRVDTKEKVDYATMYQLGCMFLRFFPEENDARAVEFGQACLKHCDKLSMAQLQAHFMLHKYDPNAVIENANKISSL